MSALFTTIVSFFQRAVAQSIPLLFGSTGEIVTEKSGHLNLGIPGIMYVGAIGGVIGGFFYETGLAKVTADSYANNFIHKLIYIMAENGEFALSTAWAIIIPLVCSMLCSLIMGLIYCFLTVTLRANQNVTGLALTTFGVGIGNFFGGSLIKLSGTDVPSITLSATSAIFSKKLPFASKLGWFGDMFLSYSFLAYTAIVVAIIAAIILKRTRIGLHLRAVGENPATADAAGINVNRYKYVSTCLGSIIAGLGGLYYVMDYACGIWSNNAFGDRGWLAIALVIFTIWKPDLAIPGSILFGGLFIVHNYISGLTMASQEIFKMTPYVVTIIVLIIVSMINKKENQPPTHLGLNYFREER